MAAPIVSGIAALLIAKEPGLPASDIRDRLLKTANADFYSKERYPENERYIAPVPGEKNQIPLLGRGVVDAEAAINNIPSQNQSPGLSAARVTSGCGTIGGRLHDAPHRFLLLVVLLVLGPLLFHPITHKRFWLRNFLR
jgi:hypothetical protein